MKIRGLYDKIKYTCEKYRSEASCVDDENRYVCNLEAHISELFESRDEFNRELLKLKDLKIAQLEKEIESVTKRFS